MTMLPTQFEDQMFSVIMTLYNLHRGQGLSHENAANRTADFLERTSTSLRNLPESDETNDQS
jgi:hypothetical protein